MHVKLTFFKPSEALRPYVRGYEFVEAGKDHPLDLSYSFFPGFEAGFLLCYFNKERGLINYRKIENEAIPNTNFIPSIKKVGYNIGFRDCLLIRIMFHPGQFLLFYYKVPMHEINEVMIDFSYVLDKGIQELYEQIGHEEELSKKVAILDAFLLRKLREVKHDAPLFNAVDQYFKKNSYNHAIADIAKFMGMTPKKMNLALNEEMGYSIERFRRIHRFNQVLKRLEKNPFEKLTDIGNEFGYYDQSHFIRDFKSITDLTPREFVKNLKGFSDLNFDEEAEHRGNIIKTPKRKR